jgi:hypothetical protein
MANTNHLETWKLFLKRMTTTMSVEVAPLAEALALAAPGGPIGFECVDSCRCDDQIIHSLFEALLDAGHPAARDPQRATEFRETIRIAIIQDQRRRSSRHAITLAVLTDVAEYDTIVSSRNARVAYARGLLPATWAAIELNK